MAAEPFEDQVRLLVRVLGELGRQDVLALKGGTAINLFLQDLPRLSVDIDLSHTGLEARPEALERIDSELRALAARLERLGLTARPGLLPGTDRAVKLVVGDGRVLVKVEVNPVLRGSVYPPERRAARPAVQERFGFAEVLTLAEPDVYAGKLVAALDRQHPRDLFDARLFLEQERFTRPVFDAFLVYLVSHPRPMHELLRPHLKPLRGEFEQAFAGMSARAVSLKDLEETRADLLAAVHAGLTDDDRAFLLGLAEGAPDWSRLPVPNARELPAVRWKLANIERMPAAKRREAVLSLGMALTL
ncbi:MAG TPA: nucleotidyl transferase AbiEii/AbiGii toxin family protein [Deinococcales bacterium]|nr:nucleotidyl transferase AbiEii/AbiGii toxin family protein [Deinococcales bacterium]